MLSSFVLLATPFVQLGLSFYLSTATLLAVATAVAFRRELSAGLTRNAYVALLALFMLPSLLAGSSGNGAQDALRVLREAILYIILFGMVVGARTSPTKVHARRLLNGLTWVSAILLALTVVQFIFLREHRYVGFPKSAYVNGADTIASALALRYSHLRPSATFSEPSYLAFVMVSFMFIALGVRRQTQGTMLAVAVCLVTGLLSQSASFVYFSAALLAVAYLQSATITRRTAMLFVTGVAVFILVAVGGANFEAISRLSQGGSVTGDYSIFVRVFGPLLVMPEYIARHPVGVPYASLPAVLWPYSSQHGVLPTEYLHNALLNMLFQYGVFGILLVGSLFLVAKDNVTRVYLLACMFFNGAFFSIDKVAIVGFAVCAYASLASGNEVRTRESVDDPSRARQGRVASPSGRRDHRRLRRSCYIGHAH